jgi:dipeptidyl-peptidase-3
MADMSPEATSKLEEILDTMLTAQPSNLGYPSETSQSSYYPSKERVTHEEAEAITKLMEARKIAPENTRLFKAARSSASGPEDLDVFEILQASAEADAKPQFLADIEVGGKRRAKVFLRRGDHSVEMIKICANLTEASKHAANDTQKLALSQLIQTFRTGDYQAFHAAQKTWVQDKAPRVEHCMGFLFGYRDPYGMRAEWQASAGVADSKETKKMSQLVGQSTEIICTLPWAVPGENNGKGPFEPSELDVPDFAVIHGQFTSQLFYEIHAILTLP